MEVTNMDYCKIIFSSMALGFMVGAVVVANNKKTRDMVKEGTDQAVKKMEEVKKMAQEKLEEYQEKKRKNAKTKEAVE